MEFWGVEVKAGEPLKVQPEFGSLIHISQASLGEVKDVKGAKNVYLRLKVDNKDFVIGSLSAEDRPQLMFDLVFEKQFELSHDLKNGSVYFMGYIADDQGSDLDIPSDDSEDVSEDEKLEIEGNVNVKPKAGDDKATNGGVAVAKAGIAAEAATEPVKEKSDSDDDEDDGRDDDSSDDDEMALDDVSGEDSDEEVDDSSEEEEPILKQSKKRPAQQVPVPATKKAKSFTPDKTGKKNGKNATPVPSKPAAGKTPVGKGPSPNKQKQSPKSGGQFSGKSGNKFNSKNGKGKRFGK